QERLDVLRLKGHQLRESAQRVREPVEAKGGFRCSPKYPRVVGAELTCAVKGFQRLLVLAQLLALKTDAIVGAGVATLAPRTPARLGARTRKKRTGVGDQEKEEDSSHSCQHDDPEMLPTDTLAPDDKEWCRFRTRPSARRSCSRVEAEWSVARTESTYRRQALHIRSNRSSRRSQRQSSTRVSFRVDGSRYQAWFFRPAPSRSTCRLRSYPLTL